MAIKRRFPVPVGNTFGTRIRLLRDKKKLSQQDLADLLRISRVMYSRYENDFNEPTYSNLLVLAEFFGVSCDYLLCRSDVSAFPPPPTTILDKSSVTRVRLGDLDPIMSAFEEAAGCGVDLHNRQNRLIAYTLDKKSHIAWICSETSVVVSALHLDSDRLELTLSILHNIESICYKYKYESIKFVLTPTDPLVSILTSVGYAKSGEYKTVVSYEKIIRK